MGKLELKTTNENFIETLKNDTIGRNKVLFRFIELLDSINENTIIALDGDWGGGDALFCLILDVASMLSYMSDFTM